ATITGMRSRILGFVQALRAEGIDVSLAETMDAARAVAAAGVEREVLRESLAACLVKDEGDRPVFDRLFDASFPLVGGEREAGRRRKRAGGGDAGALASASGSGTASGRGRPREEPADTRRREPSRTPSANRETARAERAPAGRETSDPGGRPGRLARRLTLMRLPFRDFTARDVQEARHLVRELRRRLRARLARRERPARRDLLTRATLLLVLGDARNNRRPPRADLLRAVRERVARLVWLVPEPRSRWDTGDSVLSRYAPVCDALFECIDLAALVAAVRRTF